MRRKISSEEARKMALLRLKKKPFTSKDGKRLAKLRHKKNPPSKEFMEKLAEQGLQARLKKLNK